MKSNLGLPASLFSLFQNLLILISLHPTFQSFINSEKEMEIILATYPRWGLRQGLLCMHVSPAYILNLFVLQICKVSKSRAAEHAARRYWRDLVGMFLCPLLHFKHFHITMFKRMQKKEPIKSYRLPSFHQPPCHCFNPLLLARNVLQEGFSCKRRGLKTNI